MKLTPRQARLLAGRSQEYIANQLKVHPTTYRRWERKPSLMSIGKAMEFAKLVGFRLDEISFEDESTLSRQQVV